uniref:Wiskott-Aldrich syndrome protein family member n=1 Tax=Timema bartmani TaxID=61472 RepID=A0A7R9F4H0_9NEOP|nr:unnamed protein product [Timema bartmani]
MPLPKRLVEPVHVSRGTIPEDFPLPSELEAVTNGTLANTVRQLSSLSRHAEDMFGELAREAHGLAARAGNLQARIDRLAVKVTQLDSNVEEVSLQDIHMRKAFKSCVVFDQQVVSRDTMPTAMLETYQTCDKPPPLDKLNCYREDGKDGLKFYTDANYFFDLWRQEMLKDTERMMNDRGKKVLPINVHLPFLKDSELRYQLHSPLQMLYSVLIGVCRERFTFDSKLKVPQACNDIVSPPGVCAQPHRPRNEGGGGRHKKRVRQPHNTRERQRQLAVGQGEHIMPQNIHYRTPQPVLHPDESLLLGMSLSDGRPQRPNSIELNCSYPEDSGIIYSSNKMGVYNMRHGPPLHSPTESHYRATGSYEESPYQSQQQHYAQGMSAVDGGYPNSNNHTPSRSNGGNSRGSSQRPSQPPPAPPSANNSSNSTPTVSSANNTPTRSRSMSTGRETLPPPPPPPVEAVNGSLPPHLREVVRSRSGSREGSPLPIISTSPPKLSPPKTVVQDNPTNRSKSVNPQAPAFDPRSDLLKAIRDVGEGIKLRKVEKSEQKEVERVNALHDVASILARRVAVEFSDSDSASESEYDSEGWGEQETSA